MLQLISAACTPDGVDAPVRSLSKTSLGAVATAFLASGVLAVVWVARLPSIRQALELTNSQVGLALPSTAAGAVAMISVVWRWRRGAIGYCG